MLHCVELPLVDVHIVEVPGTDRQIKVSGEEILHHATREQAERAPSRRRRRAARDGQIVPVTVVGTTPGPEFGQARTGPSCEPER